MTPRLHAIDLYNRAVPLILSSPQLAYQMLTSAVTIDPSFSLGWGLLASALADIGSLPASVAAYRKTLSLPDGPNPDDMNPATRFRMLLQLGHRLTNNAIVSWTNLAEAQIAFAEALALSDAPGGETFDRQTLAFCFTNLSMIAAHTYDRPNEMAWAEKGFVLHPDPQTELGLAFACLYQGELVRGLRHFDARFPYKLTSYQHLPWPRWNGEYVDKLFVLSEQGLGDALSFARFAPLAAAKVGEVEFPVQPELVRLLSDALKPWKNIRVTPQDRLIEHADAWCPAFSLPLPLGMTDREIEDRTFDLPIAPFEDTSWKRREARLQIAVAWAGAPANGIDMHRSIPVEKFFSLVRIPGASLYSVQVGDRAKDLHERGGTGLIRDLSPWIGDTKDTASILAEMDIVITAESFVGHLAGAMGKPCYLLCSRFGRDWRSSPYRSSALWYPNHKVVRQNDNAAWEPVFNRIVAELANPGYSRPQA